MAEQLPPHSLEIYPGEGSSCCRDPIRNLLLRVTPEESVRQRVLSWLIETKRWPANQIRTEYNCLTDGLGPGRIDIVLLTPATRIDRVRSGADQVVAAVIECKKAGDPLAEHVVDQGRGYAETTSADFFAITNGDELLTWQKSRRQQYVQTLTFPTYRQYLRQELLPPELLPRPFVRPSWSQLNDPAFLRRRLRSHGEGFVCDEAEPWIKKHAFDLWGLFRSSATAPSLPWVGHGVYVRDDWGARYKEFGNPSGGSYPGYYRTFVVDEGPGTPSRCIDLGLFSVAGAESRLDGAVRSSLIVAVSDEERRHNSLQLWIERWWRQRGEFIEVAHDGRLAFGRGGALPREMVIKRVVAKAPSLMRNGQVFLGRFPMSRRVGWSDARDLVLRLSRYALVRDRVREAARREALTR